SILQEISGVTAKAKNPAAPANQVLPPMPPVTKGAATLLRPSAMDDEALVRMQILKTAEDLAQHSSGGTISVQGVVRVAQQAGIKLKPKARTQVGNMLWKAQDKWQRVATGVYKLRDVPDVFS